MALLDRKIVLGSWARVREPREWIAAQTDSLARWLGVELGVEGWELLLPGPGPASSGDDTEGQWVRWEGDLARLVSLCPISGSFDTATADEGYSLGLFGMSSTGDGVTVRVRAGSADLGRRLPSHHVAVEVSAPEGHSVAAGIEDMVMRAMAAVFEPLEASQSTGAVNALARRGGWEVAPSYRLWLRGDVLSDAVVPVGMSAERVGAGWLYSVPDEWSAERVVAVHEEFRAVNGIDVLPH